MTALLIGFGNPGRGDDGLGPAFAERIAALDLPGLTVEVDYQLTVEHALMISEVQTVIFADAALDAVEPFYFRALNEAEAKTIGSHSVSPEAALRLSRLLFGKAPQGFVLGLAGSEYGAVSEGLSDAARRSLDLAETYFSGWYDAQCKAAS